MRMRHEHVDENGGRTGDDMGLSGSGPRSRARLGGRPNEKVAEIADPAITSRRRQVVSLQLRPSGRILSKARACVKAHLTSPRRSARTADRAPRTRGGTRVRQSISIFPRRRPDP